MMDRKTLVVVMGCILALIVWNAIIARMYPPIPKPVRPAAAPGQTNDLPARVVTALPEPPARIVEPLEPYAPRPAERLVSLRNEFVHIEFTSWGGGVRSVELLRHHVNGRENVVLNGAEMPPALSLWGVPGAGPEGAYDIQYGPGANALTMRTTTSRGVEVSKQFKLGEDYLLSASVELSRPPAERPETRSIQLSIGSAGPVSRREGMDFIGVGWLQAGKYHNRALKHAAKGTLERPVTEPVQARWAAAKNQFFTMLLTPSTNAVAMIFAQVDALPPIDWKARTAPHGIFGAVELPASDTGMGLVERYEFTWYAGPKEFDRLAALGANQEEIMQFGFFSPISVVLLKSMNFFHRLIPNYGFSIIIVTIIIKILFWPIQAKSIRSMKEMQKFQPLMQKLREKYKDDPQRMNAEMMKLYKEHKINPFAGCLPMLVQIPVFFALFTMLRTAVELRGASFLWIRDLSAPDTIAAPLGFPLNPLPLLMGASMIWQMRLTPTGGDPKQQQIMMFMPLFFLFICYNMASGLVLYWTVQQFLSIAQQWWSLRQPDAQPRPGAPLPAAGKSK
jgi:YidC/Oxa1 family membrane protein insertase